jgi:hypothetical protein
MTSKGTRTRTVKILGVVVAKRVQYGVPLKAQKVRPGEAPTRQVSRSIFGKRGGK